MGRIVVNTSDTLLLLMGGDEDDEEEEAEEGDEATREHSTFCWRHSPATSIAKGQMLEAGLDTNS